LAIPNLNDLLQGIIRGTIQPKDVFQMIAEVESTPTPQPLTWDEPEERKFEYGVSQGVLFLQRDDGRYEAGIPWNGLINISDNPDGADLNKMYADGIYYAGIRSAEEYHADIEAYTYPDEFAECDGSKQPEPGMTVGQQSRRKFALCWRSEIGNANSSSIGYKIHVAYGLSAATTEKPHDTVNDSPEAQTFTWSMDGTPVQINGFKPTAKLEFNSTKLTAARMAVVEDLLFSKSSSGLPLPNDLLNMLEYAFGEQIIGRQQITGEIDYVKDGVLYRGANAPTILLGDESELDDLAPICNPGSFAMNQDMSRMWQLDANETWVRMI